MEEIWEDIDEFKGAYQASNLGRVRSIDRIITYRNGSRRLTKGTILSIEKNKLGYAQVTLSRHDKMYSRRVHRLVAQTFIPNPNNYNEINHIDGNKENNKINNLEWCNRSQNIRHAIDNGLRERHYKGKERSWGKMRKIETGETKGLKRNFDDLGRIVIPKEFRDELGIKHKDKVEVLFPQEQLFWQE